jgi:hypothetical protein
MNKGLCGGHSEVPEPKSLFFSPNASHWRQLSPSQIPEPIARRSPSLGCPVARQARVRNGIYSIYVKQLHTCDVSSKCDGQLFFSLELNSFWIYPSIRQQTALLVPIRANCRL